MRMLRVKDVAEKLGCSVSKVWAEAANNPDFPRPVRVTVGTTAWVEGEVDEFILVQIKRSRVAPGRRDVKKAAAASVAARRGGA